MRIEQVYSELILRISSLTDLYQQIESHVSDTFSWFWTVMFGLFAVIGTALYFIARELTKDGVNKGLSKLDEKQSNLQKQVDEIAGPDMVLLWENASPASDFVGQDISLDLSVYQQIIISFNYNGNWGGVTAFCDIPSTESKIFIASNVTDKCYQRTFHVSKTGNSFENGIYWQSYGGTNVTDNRDSIPYKIYGIKV